MSKNDPLQLQIISDVKQQSKLHLETNFHQLKLSCQLWLNYNSGLKVWSG